MSLTADQAKLELIKLIDNRKIQYLNNVVTLPNDSKSHYYNKGYELSKTMFKLCSLYYIQDMRKRLNKKTTIIPFKNVDIEKEDGEEFIQRLNRFRTWVVKEKFTSIQLRFTESQKTQTNGSDVEFRIEVVVMKMKIKTR